MLAVKGEGNFLHNEREGRKFYAEWIVLRKGLQ